MASLFLSARNVLMALCVILSSAAPSVRPAHAEGLAPRAFDLPAGPLKDALARYDALTHLSVFFPSALVEGRSAAAVQGRLSPDEALHRLLEGSGLAARAVAPDAFVLLPAEPAAVIAPVAASPSTSGAAAEPERAYDGLIQSRLLQALCGREGLALGSYRLALRLRIDAAGRVAQARLLDTTGDRARDAAIVDAARRVDIGQPPADPGRPFVLLMRAQPDGAAPVCAAQP